MKKAANAIELAKNLIELYHKGQKYDKEPYTSHLTRVWNAVACAGYGEKYQVVALLHDIIEDTNISYAELEQLFEEDIIDAIACITRGKSESYLTYIEVGVMSNKIAKVVKFFDLLDNLEHSYKNEGFEDLAIRYKKALQIIALGKAEK